MTSQDLIDWAFAQDVADTDSKFVLFALAWSANSQGGGSITAARLSEITRLSESKCVRTLGRLKAGGFIIFLEQQGVFSFGLNIAGGAS